MTNIPPPAEELRLLDWELRQLESRRTQLLRRRAWLLGVLHAAGPAGPSPRPAGPPGPGATPPSAQNVLLTLGGVLLTIAAIAFTVVSWGHLGIGGRGAVLGAVTLVALGAPALLLRRSLRSTAEAVAGLALALTVLDAYALRYLALPDVDALSYAAGTSAVLATLWAGYGLLLGGLRLPLPTAVATAQLPLVLWAGAVQAGDHAMTAALLVTAAFDTALALWTTVRSVRVVALAGGCALGLWGAASAGWLSSRAADPTAAARAGVLLLFAALIALVAAWRAREPRIATGAACAGGLLTVAAVGGVLRPALPSAGAVPGYLVCGIVLLAAVRLALPRPVRRGLAAASAAAQGLAALWALPVTAMALLAPVGWATRPWSTAPQDARAALLTELPLPHPLLAPLALALIAGTLLVAPGLLGVPVGRPGPAATPPGPVNAAPGPVNAAPGPVNAPSGPVSPPSGPVNAAPDPAATPPGPAATPPGPAATPPGPAATPPNPVSAAPGPAAGRLGAVADPLGAAAGPLGGAVRNLARYGAPVLGWAAVVALPAGLGLPYAVGVSAHVMVVAALLAVAGRAGSAGQALPASVLALVSSVSVAFLALATEAATLATLGALTVLFLAVCVQLTRCPHRATAGAAVLTACAALTYATAFACAAGASWGLRPGHVGLVTLAVPALAAFAAARLGRHQLTLPVEIMAAASCAVAVTLTVGHAPTFALALALTGLIAAGTALRPDRHPAAYASGALFLLASWVRLAAWEVTAPEAYTLPATVPALLIGLLRRRRDPEVSSWTAYGPGLAATLLPSLAAAWSDPHWQRPLLLGVAALALTLAGARHRLRAPLVLGGGVLALDALHELAPYIVQVTGALPRWLPPALAGLLLLAVGATYEQRLRDARRFRNALGRMH
ncbi:SCO7613 C-terminal domain-containing membrane protein [Streptomyces sp. NRRL S-920]|uniref:SCO7613 C-terminal domain-containing membrane protein n=1 Tax=Streptomyces sp. NRRL S-920 TaxID=1463921 RepID=UPI0004C9FCCC|nr:hypothetical protein [Streptomyces sp. NRRL S-920]